MPTAIPSLGMHVPALDGVRGLAIIMVMLYHVFYKLNGALPLAVAVGRIGGLGIYGVDLFFVLSGFLITGILVDAKGRDCYFRNFYARRALRIFPLYYFTLLVLLWLIPAALRSPSVEYQRLLDSQVWYWTYLVNILVAVRQSFSAAPLNTGHFWSLAVEEQFYVLWPAVVAILTARRLRFACLSLIATSIVLRYYCAAIAHYGQDTAYAFTLTRLDGLALGALLAVSVREANGLARVRRLQWPLLVGSVGALGVLAALDRMTSPALTLWMHTFGFTVKSLFFSGLLVAATGAQAKSLAGRFFSSTIMRVHGRYSYGLYVYHFLITYWLDAYVFPWRQRPVVRPSQVGMLIAYGVVLFAISWLAAWLSFNALEQPVLRLRRYFEYSVSPRASTASAA